jgi:hypothetical protein
MTLPQVTGTLGGRGMALKVKGRILACQAINRSAEPNTLMVRVGKQRRDALLEQNPKAFYLTAHYEPHPVVLVRLSQISRTALRALLKDAWELAVGGA